MPTTSSKSVEFFISVPSKDVWDVILLEDATTHSLLDWTKHLRFSVTIIPFPDYRNIDPFAATVSPSLSTFLTQMASCFLCLLPWSYKVFVNKRG